MLTLLRSTPALGSNSAGSPPVEQPVGPPLEDQAEEVLDAGLLPADALAWLRGRSLSNLRRTPLRGPSWYRPIAANLTDLLLFAVDRPRTWEHWTHGATVPR